MPLRHGSPRCIRPQKIPISQAVPSSIGRAVHPGHERVGRGEALVVIHLEDPPGGRRAELAFLLVGHEALEARLAKGPGARREEGPLRLGEKGPGDVNLQRRAERLPRGRVSPEAAEKGTFQRHDAFLGPRSRRKRYAQGMAGRRGGARGGGGFGRGRRLVAAVRAQGPSRAARRHDDGSVRVEAGEGQAIEAQVTTEGWKIAAGEVAITESQTGDRVVIEVRLPRHQNGIDWRHRSVKVLVKVPREADLDIHTGDGAVSVAPISGRVTISTGDGSITAAGLHGEIRLHTGDGSISATGLEGRLRADTGDGHVNVRGRFDGLELRTGDGHIEALVEQGSKVSEAWSLSSGDGGITMSIPEDLGAELDAHAGSGSIVLDAPVTVTGTISESRVRGQLAGGGSPLRVHTGDGSIHLHRL